MTLGTATVVFGVLTLLVIVSGTFPVNEASDAYLILANAFLFATLIFLSLVYVESRRRNAKADARTEQTMLGVIRRLDSILTARTGLSSLLIKRSQNLIDLDQVVEKSSDYLRLLVDETRAMFEEYTTHPCSVSIKLFVRSDGKTPMVRTFMRDKKSELKRKELYPGDGLYPVTDHSPFVGIIAGDTEEYFFSNNLKDDAANGLYTNGNKQWRKLYNSTLIVPIKEPDIVARENILGFLCIDSMNAKFDARSSLYMARIVANIIFYVVSALSELERARGQNQTSKRVADA